jgi:adenylate cyclase
MSDGTSERRLAAILAADVAGYSRLMGIDEEGTLARLAGHLQELFEPLIAKHRGRIVKTTGDGLIAEFQSVVQAVRSAVAIQTCMAERNADVASDRRLDFRIGIHVGDIMERSGDIFGDGVNIAARLEGSAEPGGIHVSERVHEDAAGKVDVAFEDIGEKRLKNIARPIRVYRVRLNTQPPRRDGLTWLHPKLPDRPSVAVLPFVNMSSDPEQEYFADGIVEEIITGLSRFRSLFVIARNSTFTFKGRSVDVKQVGRELGVRYVVEGSVRRSGSRVRIAVQLVDASTGAHLWVDRFDGELTDIFDLQDRVTASIVSAIAPKLEEAEIERVSRKPTGSLDAYDYFLRGMAAFHRWNRESNGEALAQFYKAIELDPGFALAHARAAGCYARRKSAGWVSDRDHDMSEAERLARRAGELGRDDAAVLTSAGMALAFVVGDLDGGGAFVERALALNPNMAWAWFCGGWIKVWLGEHETAIARHERAMRLSPHDPQSFNMHASIGAAHFFAGRNDEALRWAGISLGEQPQSVNAASVKAAAAAFVGDEPSARAAMLQLRRLAPALRLSNLADHWPLRRQEDIDRWTEGLRRAGLPE